MEPERKRPRGRPRKRWLDIVEEDLKTVGVKEWKEIIQDREKLRDISVGGNNSNGVINASVDDDDMQ